MISLPPTRSPLSSFSLITHCQHSSAEVALSPVSKIVECREMEGADRGDAPDAGLASAVCLLQPLRRQPPPACRPPPPTAAHIQRAPTGGFFLYSTVSRVAVLLLILRPRRVRARRKSFSVRYQTARDGGAQLYTPAGITLLPHPRVSNFVELECAICGGTFTYRRCAFFLR